MGSERQDRKGMTPDEHDDAIRREARDTLKINPAASYETVLANWRYRRHGSVDEAGAARVFTILEEERVVLAEQMAAGATGWWHRIWRQLARG